MVNFCGAISVAPTSSIEIRNCQKCIYTSVYANTWHCVTPPTTTHTHTPWIWLTRQISCTCTLVTIDSGTSWRPPSCPISFFPRRHVWLLVYPHFMLITRAISRKCTFQWQLTQVALAGGPAVQFVWNLLLSPFAILSSSFISTLNVLYSILSYSFINTLLYSI